MRPNKEVCLGFMKVFKENLSKLATTDEKLCHHAMGLTSAVKLLSNAPENKDIQNMWKGLITSTINTILVLENPPTEKGLSDFASTVKVWLIDNQFRGYCHLVLLDVYKLAGVGPWSGFPLKDLLLGEITDSKKLSENLGKDPSFPVQRLRALYMASKEKEFVNYGLAILLHEKGKSIPEFENIYQRTVNSILTKAEIKDLVKYFDLSITIEVIDDLLKHGQNAKNLCCATMEYLWKHQSMDRLEEITTRWCTILSQRQSMKKLFKEIRKRLVDGETQIHSVQQCIILASVLSKVFPDTSRYICVEVLFRALNLLQPDDENHGQIETGILSSIIYFLPNSQVARYSVVSIFIKNPTPKNYFEVSKTYKAKVDKTGQEDKSEDETELERLKILDYLQLSWPSEFMLCSTWAWMRLRKLCLETMKPDEAAFVQQVEMEEAQKSLGHEIKNLEQSKCIGPTKEKVRGFGEAS